VVSEQADLAALSSRYEVILCGSLITVEGVPVRDAELAVAGLRLAHGHIADADHHVKELRMSSLSCKESMNIFT
jgi:hypothetical protein